MYSFTGSRGLFDCRDEQSMALLQQRTNIPLHRSVANHMYSQQGCATPSLYNGLSAAELMSASSRQSHERMISDELLKRQQVAAAIALASRNQAISKQQQDHKKTCRPEDFILNRAMGQLCSISGLPINYGSQAQNSHQALGSNKTIYCTEQDLSLEKDICFGRGQRVQRRKANVAFRKIVATYQETYDQAVSREDKKAVVKKVARIFSRTGYRFFKESEETARFGNGTKLWSAVLDHHVEYKIGHSFRSGRKQLKQQKNKRKEKEGTDSSVCSTNEVEENKSQSHDLNEPKNHCVYKDEELSEKCICIGDKHEKYTGMEAYQYFREFILTFKSILDMTESLVEKTKVVSSLIDQFKSQKGYKFLKLMPLKKDAEFWVEANAEEISSEVFSIIGSPLEQNKNESATNPDSSEAQEKQKDLKRRPDSSGESVDAVPKKKKRVSQDSLAPKESTPSSSTNNDKIDPKLVLNKGRKRTSSEDSKKQAIVPSEIICKSSIDLAGEVPPKNGTDETRSAIASQGVRIPQSLFSPQVLMGKVPFGNPTCGVIERSLEMLRASKSLANPRSGDNTLVRNRLSTQQWSGQSTLEKALFAMRPSSIQHTSEEPLVEATSQLQMKGKMLQQLREQEMLYLDKKRKLALLELQLRCQNGGV